MMKRVSILAALALGLLASPAQAVTCFWYGGTGNINDTAHWSANSGNSPVAACAGTGGLPQGGTDVATFDANSGGGVVTRNVAFGSNQIVLSAFTGTFGNSTDTADLSFNTFTNTGSGTRTINMGAGNWNCGKYLGSTTICSFALVGATNLTWVPNSSTLNLYGSNATQSQNFTPGTFSFNNLVFKAETISGFRGTSYNGQPTIASLTIEAPNYLSVNNTGSTTATALSFVGGTHSITSMISLIGTAFNNRSTFSTASTPTCDFCAFREIQISGGGSVNATNSIDLGDNSGITFTAPQIGGGGGRIIGG